MPSTVAEYLEEGNLPEAIRLQSSIVETAPQDRANRLTLAELLLFDGDLDKVREQLKPLDDGTPEMQAYLQEWDDMLESEQCRRSGAVDLLCEMGPSHRARLDMMILLNDISLGLATDNDNMNKKFLKLLDKAERNAPQISGHVNGREVDGVEDTDQLLGPFLECYFEGEYFWISFESIRRLKFEPIKDLRDQFARPARLRLKKPDPKWPEDEVIRVPCLYELSYLAEEPALRCGRETDYREVNGLVRGYGLRLLDFGEEELTFWDFDMWESR